MADTGSEMNGAGLAEPQELQQEGLINTNVGEEANDDGDGEDLLRLALEHVDETTGDLANNTVSNELVEAVTNDAFQGTIGDSESGTLSFENATYVVSGDSVNFATDNSSSQYEVQTNENSNNGSMTVSFAPSQQNENSNGSGIGNTSGAMTVTLVAANEGSGAPLGSSQNPIRIIQQGNQYTPVQQLTTDQLQQIMQVVQQQQVAKSASDGGGSSVLYNPQTNTKIVYRVIYPSELHKSSSSAGSQSSQGQQTVVQFGPLPKRQYKKKLKEEEEKVDAPELTREEKEARKKHRPRTRSGRVSKPPKHMMKDYKHIHVVDWDEDYDDSDGGYSDFKYSEDEEKEEENNIDGDFIFDTGQVRPKNWKCKTCHKSYIGKGGLGRHYRLNPAHGNADELPQDESDSSNLSKATPNGMSYAGSLSEDSNTQDSVLGIPHSHSHIRPGRPRKKGQRGRPPLYEQNPAHKRHKLREFINNYDTEDLMDIVLPRLAKVVTLWEFLMMKVESSNTNKPNIQSVYEEFETLTEKVKDLFKKCLKLSDNTTEGVSAKKLKMSNAKVAESIGFQMGTYDVNTAILQSSFQDFAMDDNDRNENFRQHIVKQKRPNTIEVMMGPSVESPTKRFKSLLPNDKKSTNIVVSTKGNIVLMGTSQNTSPSSQRVVLVNSAQTPHTTSNPLIVVNKNQTNSSAAVLECVQSQPTGTVLGVNQSQPSTIVLSTQSENTVSNQVFVNKQTFTPTKGQVVVSANSIGNEIVSAKPSSATLNNKTSSIPQSISYQGKSQSVNSSPKPSSNLQAAKTNVVKSSGITILPINNSTGFNSVGTLSSVYNTSLLSNQTVQKPNEGLTNDIGVIPSVVTSDGVIISQNGIVGSNINSNNSASLTIVKPEITDDGTLIISDLNNVDQNGTSEQPILVTTNTNSVSEQVTMGETLMQTNDMEPTQMVQFVNNQLVTNEQVNPAENIITASNIYQTPEGIIIIQNPDGSTVQLQGSDGEPIPLETVQALLEGQYLQTGEEGVILNQ